MLRNIRCPIVFSAETEARHPPIQRKARVGASWHGSSVFAMCQDEGSVLSSKSRNILPSDQTQWAEYSVQSRPRKIVKTDRSLFLGSAAEEYLETTAATAGKTASHERLIYRLSRMRS